MRMKIQTDYKTYSEAQNITAKSERLIQITEECSQLLTSYSFRQINWNDWAAGNFA
jgi:hypothetical protein